MKMKHWFSWRKKGILIQENPSGYRWLFRRKHRVYTAMKFWLYTIADIWSKVGVLWGGLMYPKSPAKPFTGWLQTVRHQIFPLRYYRTLYLKGLQNCGPSKFAVKRKKLTFWVRGYFFAILYSNRRSSGGPGSIPGRGFEGPQLCSPLVCNNVLYLFGNL